MPSVSIVISTYNRAQMLPRAIESAQQAGSDLEVIVVDDCSTDGTPELCARLENIRYFRLESNRGLANGRNVGIAESASEFIAFLDDDDLRLPGSIDKQLRVLHENPSAALCFGQALLADARRQLPTGEMYPLRCPQGDIFWELLEHNFIPMPTVVARKSSLLDSDCFNTKVNPLEDWDMWLRMSERFPVVALEEPVAIYRKAIAESEQMCSNPASVCQQALFVQQMALNRPRALKAPRAKRREVRRKLRDRVYEILMTEATNSIQAGNTDSARASLRDAFRYRPVRTVVSGRLPWLLPGLR